MEAVNAWIQTVPATVRNITNFKSGKHVVEEWKAKGAGELILIPSKLAGMACFYSQLLQWGSVKLHFASQNQLPQSIDNVLVVHNITEEGGSAIGFTDAYGVETGWWCYIEAKNIRGRINELLAESCELTQKKVHRRDSDLFWMCVEAAVRGLRQVVGIEVQGQLAEVSVIDEETRNGPGSLLLPLSSVVQPPRLLCGSDTVLRNAHRHHPLSDGNMVKGLGASTVTQDPFTDG